MEWKLIDEKPVDGGAQITVQVSGYTLNTIIRDGPDRDRIVELYAQEVAKLVAANEQRRAAMVTAPEAPTHKGGGCGCAGKKSLGLISLGKALLGGHATPEVAQARLSICQACQATDPTGAPLYRVIDGKAYCGIPRLSDSARVYRDEREWGCGCDLAWKAGMAEAGCPLTQWSKLS